MSNRRYSQQEVAAILKRAAELQRDDPSSGLSQAELEQIARDSGIDPNKVQRAIADLDAGQAEAGGWFLGAPTVVRFERTIPGDLAEEDVAEMVVEVERAFSCRGTLSQVGHYWTWTANRQHGADATSVRLIDRKGDVTIELEENKRASAGNLFGGIMGGVGGGGIGAAMGIGLGALRSPPLAMLLAIAFVGGSWLLARSLHAGSVRRTRDRMTRLLARLVDRAEAAADRSRTEDRAVREASESDVAAVERAQGRPRQRDTQRS